MCIIKKEKGTCLTQETKLSLMLALNLQVHMVYTPPSGFPVGSKQLTCFRWA